MTAPSVMKLPHLNLEAFQQALDRTLVEVDGLDIKTRAEVRLEDSQATLARLDLEGAEARQEIARTKDAIQELNKLLVKQESVEADIAMERNAVIQMIHALTQSGVGAARAEVKN